MDGGYSALAVFLQAGKDTGPLAAPAMNVVGTIEIGFLQTTKQHARHIEIVQLLTTVWAEVRRPLSHPTMACACLPPPPSRAAGAKFLKAKGAP